MAALDNILILHDPVAMQDTVHSRTPEMRSPHLPVHLEKAPNAGADSGVDNWVRSNPLAEARYVPTNTH